jgi:hypothetical protein
LAKVDKSQYSKAQWQKIRQQRRYEKALKVEDTGCPVPSPALNPKYHLLCVKHGNKYSAEYVNTLYRMVSRNCSLEFGFVCLTDDVTGIDPNITTVPLPRELKGWWAKPYMFSNDLGLDGVILYMDLDVVIAGNIDKLFTYSPRSWCIIKDFTRALRPNWKKYNSSVIRFNSGQLDHLWKDFKENRIEYQRKFFGDQDWLYAKAEPNPIFWPDEWIQSWKWEIRKSKQFAPGGRRGNRRFNEIEYVTPKPECCITVFHGDPNPELVEDPWVVQNWK